MATLSLEPWEPHLSWLANINCNIMQSNDTFSVTNTISTTYLSWQMFTHGNKVCFLSLSFQKIYYEVDWQKFTCKKMPLDASFVPIQVPPDANLMGQVVMGSSSSWGMGILINTWYGRLPENGKKEYHILNHKITLFYQTFMSHLLFLHMLTMFNVKWHLIESG